MFRGSPQDSPHVRSLGIRRPDGIITIRQRNGSVHAQVHDRLGLAHKTMNMAWRMIVRIGNESNTVNP